jgi:transglutaminase-like putative cysteine protease
MPSPDRPETTMRYRCRHVTRYEYAETVSVSQHLLHLKPRPHPRQTVHSTSLTLAPAPASGAEWTDFFGNAATYVAIDEPHGVLTIDAGLELTVVAPPPRDGLPLPAWETVRDAVLDAGSPEAGEAAAYAFDSRLVSARPELAAYARPSFAARRPVAEAAMDLMHRIHADFAFDPAATTVSTPLGEVLASRRGVCQDFAHLAVGCLRSFGVPCRYVSGYLRTHPPPGSPRLVGADASHAWFSVWCGPEDGWLDLDPTNDRPADLDHITIAWGRDYDDVSPVRGVLLGGAGHALSVEVDVEAVEGS